MRRRSLVVVVVASLVLLGFAAIMAATAWITHATANTACGPGTIAFRAPPAHEKRATCGEGSWYDGGYRDYVAQPSEPVRSTYVTLVLLHRQAAANGGQGGVLLRKVIRVSRSERTVLRGRIDFSVVYAVNSPAGAPPFGTYILTIRRGTSSQGTLLARGTFDVIED